jgi:hypothetical protein
VEAGFCKTAASAMRGFPAPVAQRHGGSLNHFPFGESTMIASNLSILRDAQQQFVAFLPALSGRLSSRFRYRDPEGKADAIAEGIGLAWQLYLPARMSGKTVTVGNLAFYAGRLVDSGRKVAGSSSTDALSEGTLARKKMTTGLVTAQGRNFVLSVGFSCGEGTLGGLSFHDHGRTLSCSGVVYSLLPRGYDRSAPKGGNRY